MNSNNSDKLFCELFGEDGDDDGEEDEDINADLRFLEPSEPTYQVEEPVPGLVIYRQVLSHTLCTQYFAWLTNEYFSQSKVNQGMHFGSLDDKAPLRLLSQISHKLPRLLPTTVGFDQAIVNLYECGDGIGDHVDLMRFEDGIVGFSFGGSAVMRMRRVRDMKAAARYARELETEDPSEIAVMLGAGDVYALSGEARYQWTHGIPKQINGIDNIKSPRISVTLRKLADGKSIN
ncbi:hypothetical protein GGI00_002008 [Coemansia sp. RSA 2681]|nr:hypothetical protein GGI00_002008 [Coemansia sp. RSA 2681]